MSIRTKPAIRFAQRVRDIRTSPTLIVLERARELAARGIDVIDLGPGEPDFDTPEYVRLAGNRAIDTGLTRYTNTLGTPEIRNAVAATYNRRYGTSLGIENVIVGTGGKQELFNAMLALVGEGDEVIIPVPYWVSFPDQVAFAGGIPVFAPMAHENHLRPTLGSIEPFVTPATRGVILNSPCNPSGAVVEEHELARIIRFCRSRDLFLLFDETYEFFVYDGVRHVSAIQWFHEFPETLIVVNSMSKSFAMTGWRLGYAIAHPQIIEALGRIQSHSTSNASSIAQHAATEALNAGNGEVRHMYQEYVRRRAWLFPALNEVPGFECPPPDGAFYVFPRVSDLYDRISIRSSTALAAYLLEEAHVAVVPGSAFGADEHIRISYATSLESLQEGVSRIRRAVEKLRAR